MRTIKSSRRMALKFMLAGSVVSLGTSCAELQTLQNRGTTGSTTDGSSLAIDVRKALRNHPNTARLALEISSVEDEVTLAGFVETELDFYNAEQVANQVGGVRHVKMDVYIR